MAATGLPSDRPRAGLALDLPNHLMDRESGGK